MIIFEICYTSDLEEEPEHYGYYDNYKDAKEAIDQIEKMCSEIDEIKKMCSEEEN